MRTKIILTATILLIAVVTFAAPPSEEGKTIFTARCAACHNVNKILVGPALAGVDQRRSIEWIVKFVHSPKTIIQSGDPYAVALFNKFKVQMPDHPDLTDANIKSIVEYIKTEAQAGETKPVAKTEPAKTDFIAMILTNKGLLASSLLLVAILLAALWFLMTTKQVQRSKTA